MKYRQCPSSGKIKLKWKWNKIKKNKILISQVPHPEFRVQFSEKHKLAKLSPQHAPPLIKHLHHKSHRQIPKQLNRMLFCKTNHVQGQFITDKLAAVGGA